VTFPIFQYLLRDSLRRSAELSWNLPWKMKARKDQNAKVLSEIRIGFKFQRLTPSSHGEKLFLNQKRKSTILEDLGEICLILVLFSGSPTRPRSEGNPEEIEKTIKMSQNYFSSQICLQSDWNYYFSWPITAAGVTGSEYWLVDFLIFLGWDRAVPRTRPPHWICSCQNRKTLESSISKKMCFLKISNRSKKIVFQS
jgi:hypothetical protein